MPPPITDVELLRRLRTALEPFALHPPSGGLKRACDVFEAYVFVMVGSRLCAHHGWAATTAPNRPYARLLNGAAIRFRTAPGSPSDEGFLRYVHPRFLWWGHQMEHQVRVRGVSGTTHNADICVLQRYFLNPPLPSHHAAYALVECKLHREAPSLDIAREMIGWREEITPGRTAMLSAAYRVTANAEALLSHWSIAVAQNLTRRGNAAKFSALARRIHEAAI